jgi:TonB family protein
MRLNKNAMFLADITAKPPAPRRPGLWVSLGFHTVFLVWLLHAPAPIFVAPSSGLAGLHGATITHLYWPAASGEESALPSPAKLADANAVPLMLSKQRARHASGPTPPALHHPEDPTKTAEIADASAGASAGNPYGSLSDGQETGHEIRPALPVFTFEPVVDRSQLPGGVEGNCVIEITIDEAGAVVATSVVQSLGASIDAQVRSAVEHWKFRPATRDGVPIPSKQDVVYHFKPS